MRCNLNKSLLILCFLLCTWLLSIGSAVAQSDTFNAYPGAPSASGLAAYTSGFYPAYPYSSYYPSPYYSNYPCDYQYNCPFYANYPCAYPYYANYPCTYPYCSNCPCDYSCDCCNYLYCTC
jgi:hypothetical protein